MWTHKRPSGDKGLNAKSAEKGDCALVDSRPFAVLRPSAGLALTSPACSDPVQNPFGRVCFADLARPLQVGCLALGFFFRPREDDQRPLGEGHGLAVCVAARLRGETSVEGGEARSDALKSLQSEGSNDTWRKASARPDFLRRFSRGWRGLTCLSDFGSPRLLSAEEGARGRRLPLLRWPPAKGHSQGWRDGCHFAF